MVLNEVLSLVKAGFSKADIEKLQAESPSAFVQETNVNQSGLKNVAVQETNVNQPENIKNNEFDNRAVFDYKALAKAMVEANQEYNRSIDYSANHSNSDLGKFF